MKKDKEYYLQKICDTINSMPTAEKQKEMIDFLIFIIDNKQKYLIGKGKITKERAEKVIDDWENQRATYPLDRQSVNRDYPFSEISDSTD